MLEADKNKIIDVDRRLSIAVNVLIRFNKQKQETNNELVVKNPDLLDIIEPDESHRPNKPDKNINEPEKSDDPDINDPELWTIIKNKAMPVLQSVAPVVNSKQPIVNDNIGSISNKRKKDNDNSGNQTKNSDKTSSDNTNANTNGSANKQTKNK
jgi:hypothetical protein